MEILHIAISGGAVTAILAGIAAIVLRRPYLGLIFVFFFFAFAWRISNAFVIDVFGPLYADELYRQIGPGISSLPLAIAQGLVIISILVSFRPGRLRALAESTRDSVLGHLPPGPFTLSDLAFVIILPFVAALYFELYSVGHVPLFEKLEPLAYRQLYAGPLHHLLFDWGAMLAFQLGVFFSTPRLGGKPFDWRFAGILFSLFIYHFLVGARFSPFYLYGSFFSMPVGIILLHQHFAAASSAEAEQRRREIVRRLLIGGALVFAFVACTIIYSFAVVRSFHGDELTFKVTQRLFVQQGELWWMTYERIFLYGDWNFSHAAAAIFLHPLYTHRNSTLQYLMEMALPLERAKDLLGQGSSYTGGWPEVLFELGGPVGGFVAATLSAFCFSEFMYFVTRCVIQQRYATTFFLTPILYAVSVYLVSGMVNSFIQLTFLAKIFAAAFFYLLEDRWRLVLALQPAAQETR